MTPRVLILTASYGTGHVIVAKALDEAFRKSGVESTVIDLVEAGEKTEKIGKKFYEFLMKHGHFVWKFYHEKIMPIRKGDSIRKIYKSLHRQKFFKEIEEINPDIIISTMDQASVIASLYKQSLQSSVLPAGLKEDHPDVKIATVLTDYVAHPLWVWKNMDYYFVGSEDIRQYLIKHGIDGSKIFMTGIPLRQQFEKILDKKEARNKLGLPHDKIVLLVSAGSFGSVPISKVVSVVRDRQDVLVVILSGNDEKVPIYADLLQQNGVIGKVISYTNEIEIFMSASDLFISKAGGVSVAECLRCGLPAIYVNNFPGHEIGNALFTEKHGASQIVKKVEDLSEVLNNVLLSKDKIKEMSVSAKKISTPNASSDIVKTLL